MLKSYSIARSGSKKLLLLTLLAILTLTFCSKETQPSVVKLSDVIEPTTYRDVELHSDAARSEELGIPFFAKYTASGELFTGTQRIYHVENDSLYMELFYEDGINTGALIPKDGYTHRSKLSLYRGMPHVDEMYMNEVLVYQDIPPSQNEDGLGRNRLWHRNGQLALEGYYSGHTGNNILRQGLMTLYDEEGNITEQKRYKDDEVVETIIGE